MPNILITGGSGLIGQFLTNSNSLKNYKCRILSRSERSNEANLEYFQWDLEEGTIDPKALIGVDHILCLAGAGIADKRWTESRKKELIDSRVEGNELLYKELKKHNVRPKSIVCASAIGYYGDRGEQKLTEESKPGQDGFLEEVTILWEESMENLRSLTDHFAKIRIGIVLSTKGGALEKMLLPLRFGISGYFGNGEQYYSWIHIEDLSNLMQACLFNKDYIGTFNGVSQAIKLKEFAKAIKNTYLPVSMAMPIPAFGLKLAMGEMATMLTNSTRVIPQKAKELGFLFQHENLEKAVEDLVKRKI